MVSAAAALTSKAVKARIRSALDDLIITPNVLSLNSQSERRLCQVKEDILKHWLLVIAAACLINGFALAQDTNSLWHQTKVKNYLPDMSWPEVQALLTRTDMVIIPVGALEQHSLQGPIGTDFLNSTEESKLIAQRTDILVAPILLPGNSPYHMEFPGTIT